mmetsp:Transcript_49434/g.137404  ORF Transcript_49434/g.137404 Transcript_49434/m.137404 type:complete len:865 (-) Transcript_49434:125-2719(-)
MAANTSVASTAAVTQSTGGISSALGFGTLKRSQFEILQNLVSKHLTDPSLIHFATGDDFSVTSLERGIPRYEHSHLVAALDVLLMYQRNRRSQASYSFIPSMRSSFRHDPRTRVIELYKRWLRTHAANASVGEDDVRRMCALCRDILNHPRLFPSRNPRSFMHTLAEVYDHLKLQLREVLERDRTCAELAGRALCLSRNLISDAIAYLMLAATDLKQTDKLPSLEVVYLWQSLPVESNPLPARADRELQRVMKDVWHTMCGSLIASLLSVRWAFRLFDGSGAEDEAVATARATAAAKTLQEVSPSGCQAAGVSVHPADSVPALIAHVGAEFEQGNFKASGLAGAFREPQQKAGRQSYLIAIEAVFDLIYLLGDVLVQFHRISDGLGDYGMIRVAPWLHPFLEVLVEKVQRLRASLETMTEAVDAELVLAKARGRKLKQPAPTQTMCARAHAAIARAITGSDCHAQLLLQVFEELRSRSAPERLPHVMEGIGDACTQLQHALTSPQFLSRVGDSFRDLPPLSAMTDMGRVSAPTSLSIEEVDGDMSEEEGGPGGGTPSIASVLGDGQDTSGVGESDGFTITGFHVRRRAASVGRAGKAAFCRMTTRRSQEQLTDAGQDDAKPFASPDLHDDGWISHETSSGRKFWHHSSLGHPPWEQVPANPDSVAPSASVQTAGQLIQSTADVDPDPAKSPESQKCANFVPHTHPRTGATGMPACAELGAGVTRNIDVPAAAAPIASDLRAEVHRLTVAMRGWKQHDCRSLLLTGEELHIFEKGSKDHVKTVVKVADELEVCALLGNGIMSLQIRRARRSGIFCGSVATDDAYVAERKVYLFEFRDASVAEAFHSEISRLRGRGPTLASLQTRD